MSNDQQTEAESFLPDFNSTSAVTYRHFRHVKDVATRYLMAAGGISVIIAITLIAFYLFYVVMPMFKGAEIELVSSYSIPGNDDETTLYLAMEEQHEVGMRINESGEVIFFSTVNGDLRDTFQIPVPAYAEITAISYGDPAERMVGLGLSDGTVVLFQHNYKISYPDDKRLITPELYYPFGQQPLQVLSSGDAIQHLSVQYDEEQATIAAKGYGARVMLLNLSREESMLSDEVEIVEQTGELLLEAEQLQQLIIDKEQRELYAAAESGQIYYFDITDKSDAELIHKVQAVDQGVKITAMEFLTGGISILVGDSNGHIAQWFPVRDENNNYTLEKIRSFEKRDKAIIQIVPEYFRKGFLAINDANELGIYHTTAHRTVLLESIASEGLESLTISPRANAMLIKTADGQLHYWHIDNEHPEISFKSIWGKVWYESRSQPEYIWQSSSASSDFEPKFSLSPLAFGTLKASFYAMLFAMPLAILGAMYTAYFMSSKMRQVVKPTIEIMEALPTVILGFLAGLWLAPFVEKHLPGMFIMLVTIPVSVLLSAAVWGQLPGKVRHKIPDGWEAALLAPVIIIAVLISVQISQPIENLFFNGNMPLWLSQEMGITYDQRNSLVVGIAMGFAVIPTIFSISEDAIYSVPKHLTTGSLALGATPWQTMVRVVLLTASPGIFSAIMIGLGRAVGETMIVVMATGNTAIMDLSIFEGFRALSANIAVEMPESEVGSTHYRILFLAGLVLFIATFFFNTVAELVRQRLRTKYSSL